jgi:DNA polymerase-3 subunit delta
LTGKGKNKLKPAYLITGSDDTKVEAAARRLRQRVVEDSGTDLNVDIFDAASDGADTVAGAAMTLPFGEGVRLVMVMNAGQWRKAEKDIIVSLLGEPQQHYCLALVGPGIRKNEALYKAVAAAGEVLVYDAPRDADMPAWTVKQAESRRLKLGMAEARRLAAVSGNDQRQIITEIEKLAAYKGSGRVELDDINAVCWVSADVRVWDLTDAIGSRDREAVFRNLEELMADRSEAGSVFFTVASHLKRLCAVTEARERGEDPLKVAAGLGIKPFPARKIAAQSSNFTAAELKKALSLMAELDADIKGRSDRRSDLLLEIAVAHLLERV